MNRYAFLILGLSLLGLTLPLASAQVAVESFSLYPQTAQIGDEVTIRLTMLNGGDETIEDVLVALDIAALPFAPVSSSNEKSVGKIYDYDHEQVHFQLKVLSFAEPMVYKIPVVISYAGKSRTSLVSIEVTAKPVLEVYLDSALLVQGQPSKVQLKFVNSGPSQVKSLRVTHTESTQYLITSAPSLYIGEVDVEDFETGDYTIIPHVEESSLRILLEYQDQNHRFYSEQRELLLHAYNAQQAQRLGLVGGQGRFLVVMGIIVVVILGFWIYKRARRKHAQ